MSLKAFHVRKNWAELTRRMEEDRRTIWRVVFGIVALSAIMTLIIQRLPLSVALESTIIEAISFCLFYAVVTWYALRFKKEAKWVVLGIYIWVLLSAVLFNYLTKAGLPGPLHGNQRVYSPTLYFSTLLMLNWIALGWLIHRYPREVKAVGLDLSRPKLKVLYGLLAGGMVGGHFIFTASFSKMLSFSLKPLPYLTWQLFYELGLRSLGQELFFRGLVFNYLYRARQWGFWAAALLASLLNLSIYLGVWGRGNPVITAGMLFYIFIMAVINAALYRWSDSIISPVVSSAVFNLLIVLC